jgi:hypothetical protein
MAKWSRSTSGETGDSVAVVVKREKRRLNGNGGYKD